MWNAANWPTLWSDAAGYGSASPATHTTGRRSRGRDPMLKKVERHLPAEPGTQGHDGIQGAGAFTAAKQVTKTARLSLALPCSHRRAVIHRPDLPGLSGGYLDGFFELEALPRRTAVIGSGYRGGKLLPGCCEAGQRGVRWSGTMGCCVPSSRLGRHLVEHMRTAGIDVVTGAVPEAVQSRDGGLSVSTADGRAFEGFDCVLWAIGRLPNTAELNLSAAGVATGPRGYVNVDDFQNAGVEGIYAVGDVTGRAQLTPVAIAAGRRLADRLFGGQSDRRLSYENIPSVIFSHPPVGTVGLTEVQARERFGDDSVRSTGRNSCRCTTP